ncbi:MAG: hypothetical protein JXA77_06915 [Bacteroidales bacterium]|nr:hypothetical protein [Bacteroidales bacterium]MBN2819867.1 hypothetical protein [Bacteroidales bacterium]
MKTQNIDSEINKIISESVSFFDSEADNAKERIWQHLQLNEQQQIKPIWFRALAAACILLFFTTSVFTISYRKADRKISALTELNSSLQKQVELKNAIYQKESQVETYTAVPDTFFIEKIVSVPFTVMEIQKIVDTIYVDRTVYIEKESSMQMATALSDDFSFVPSAQLRADYYETRILLSSSESIKQKKERKLQLMFGSNKIQSKEGILSFRAEL